MRNYCGKKKSTNNGREKVLSKLMRVSDENLLAHDNIEEMESLTSELLSRGFEIKSATSQMGCQLSKFPLCEATLTLSPSFLHA